MHSVSLQYHRYLPPWWQYWVIQKSVSKSVPDFQNPNFQCLASKGRLHPCDFLGPDGQLFSSACATAADPPLDIWSSLQMRSFLHQCSRSPGILHQLTEFEDVCHRKEQILHCLWLTYPSLIQPATGFVPKFLSEWESDLATHFCDSQKEKILHFAQRSSMATRIQETGYKILTPWYRVPTTLHYFFPQVPSTC